MRALMARAARAAILGLMVLTAGSAEAQCVNALSPPDQLDRGNALELYQAGLSAMRADRMDEADHLLRSSFARLSDAPGEAAAMLEPMVLARLVEVAVQRKDLTTGMFRMKVLRERLERRPDHPGWIEQVMKMADLATIRQQNAVAGTDEAGACRAFGVAVRSAARINFETGSTTIDEEARTGIAQIAKNLLSNTAGRIMVRGHTDVRGTDAYNDALSLRRANAVIALLVAAEPALADKLVAQGAGKREPLYPGDDDDSYRLNRRVEFVPVKAP